MRIAHSNDGAQMHAKRNEYANTLPKTTPPPLDLRRHALFLDLDGTLLDLAERPHAVIVSAELRNTLRELADQMAGAVAVVTGRTLADADSLLHGALDYVAGVHGYEIQRGAHTSRDSHEVGALDRARDEVQHLLQQHAIRALIEDKGAGLALHYRHAPEAGPEVRRLGAAIASKHGLRLLEGKMVVELVASRRTKGHAVTVFMAAPPFSGRVPIAIGDDRTDEDAFAAAARLGGFGILVGDPRASTASHTLAGPAAVIAWLQSAIRP